ncbi:MAG: chlorite dismutase family protein [Alicyclobacillaceae bacterium]|nr:chlorite dismutase family protein [Alicyclobacillaceae bacterium]
MDVKFTGHLALARSPRWDALEAKARQDAVRTVTALFDRYADRVTLRGAYLTQGFRADTDLLLWMYADRFDDIQDLQLELRQTDFGRAWETPWAFAGITLESEFNKNHVPAFLRGVPPKTYLCFYPFIRTPEWYLLPEEQRADMLKEHGAFGREYPEVRTNNVYAFGLGDYEWLLSFETDDLAMLVQMVRRQREARARAYTKHEWPFIVGRRFELSEALARLS